jgi:hypothetical protein
MDEFHRKYVSNYFLFFFEGFLGKLNELNGDKLLK